MLDTLDEATNRFLETARADLQRQLGSAGIVEAVIIERHETQSTSTPRCGSAAARSSSPGPAKT